MHATIYVIMSAVLILSCSLHAQDQLSRRNNKLHVSIGAGWGYYNMLDSIDKAFQDAGVYGTNWHHKNSGTIYPVMSAEYSVHRRIRLGIAMQEIPVQSIASGYEIIESAKGVALSFTGEYVIVPYRSVLARGIEIILGAGYGSDIVDIQIDRDGSGIAAEPDYKKTRYVDGVSFKGSTDYYFSPSVSVRCLVGGRLMQNVTIPSYRFVYGIDGYWDEDRNEYIQEQRTNEIGEHKVKSSTLVLQLSLMFHL
jgi:hypothetical protein